MIQSSPGLGVGLLRGPYLITEEPLGLVQHVKAMSHHNCDVNPSVPITS